VADPRSQLGDASAPRLGALWSAAWQSVPDAITRTLRDGAAALDVNCGAGLACLALAEAMTGARVTGHDVDVQAIERARALAQAARLEHRVRFAVDDSTRLPHAAYTLVTAEDLQSRAREPFRVLNAIRNALTSTGACLLLEPAYPRTPVAPGTPLLRLEALATRAGFSRVRLLPSEPRVRLYELRR
jgi:2-polyprenyl-3-methyl-5-hydroxy-6-metoxy-1,4-benzoquinol methylase